jgi:membrane fusion protein, copper/silver efflux system
MIERRDTCRLAAGQPGSRGLVRGMVLMVLAGVAATALVAAGAFWHEPIGSWFAPHRHKHEAPRAGTADPLWTCGMHPQVIQQKAGTCPICQMKLEPMAAVTGRGDAGDGQRKIKYWWDPMLGPSSISDKPGKSAMGMDLVPVYEDELAGGATVTIDPVVVQNMGVRVAEVKQGSIQRVIRAVGYLNEAQPGIRDVNLRVSGWIEKLYAATEGQHVVEGEALFDLYSPELQVALEELIGARRGLEALGAAADELSRRNAEVLLESARRKLQQWQLTEAQIEELSRLDTAPRVVTFLAPITGHLVEKHVVEGAAVRAGDRVLRIVDHTTLWLDAQVFEQDLPFIRLGQDITATIQGLPGKGCDGEVIFIHPHVDPATRTATVRMALPNADLELRPGMFATAQIAADLQGQTPLTPREAVIDTGSRQIVFVAAGQGRFEPRHVTLGASGADGMVQVLKGLAPGDLVVTSGQFLLDAESRMNEAIQRHLDQNLLSQRPEPAQVPDLNQFTTDAKIPWSPEVDALYRQYLVVAEVLGAAEPPESPLILEKFIAAARALADVTAESDQHLPAQILQFATAMESQPIEEQRKLFKDVSEAIVVLAQASPPSEAIAGELFVMYCPMKKAHWLQDEPELANPYYATEMKRCGQIKQTVKSSTGAK